MIGSVDPCRWPDARCLLVRAPVGDASMRFIAVCQAYVVMRKKNLGSAVLRNPHPSIHPSIHTFPEAGVIGEIEGR